MTTPATQAGRALAQRLKWATVYAPTADADILAIEAEAVKPWRELREAYHYLYQMVSRTPSADLPDSIKSAERVVTRALLAGDGK